MAPLGFYNVCLKADHLDNTVAFYRGLGFEPTGEDAPGLRVSLASGADVLTFMTFIKAGLINFRGAHIHSLMEQLQARGVDVTGYNEHPDQPLLEDEAGKPLADNECGHFTVHDPDGHELFFNTHPWERAPFEAELRRAQPVAGPGSAVNGEQPLLGRFVYCLHVIDLQASRLFYETLGLVATPIPGGVRVTTPALHRGIHFVLHLRRSSAVGASLQFFCDIGNGAAWRDRGFVQEPGGWIGVDPDGRTLELYPAADLPVG